MTAATFKGRPMTFLTLQLDADGKCVAWWRTVDHDPVLTDLDRDEAQALIAGIFNGAFALSPIDAPPPTTAVN